MARLDAESANLGLMALAEAFHVTDGDVAGLLSLAMEARLFLDEGKAVYKLLAPIKLDNGEMVTEFRLRQPTAADYLSYTKGTSVTVKDGAAQIDAVMMGRRTVRTVSDMSGVALGIVERMIRKDLGTLQEVCDVLGFFE